MLKLLHRGRSRAEVSSKGSAVWTLQLEKKKQLFLFNANLAKDLCKWRGVLWWCVFVDFVSSPCVRFTCFGPEPSICTVAAATTLLFVPRRLLTSRGTAIQDVECTDWIQPRDGDPTYSHLVEKDLSVWLMYKSIKSRCP